MKRIISIFLTVSVVCMICGCDNFGGVYSSESAGENVVSSEQPVSSAEEILKDPVVKTAVTSEADLEQFNKIYKYGDDEFESYIFWAECDMTDVALSVINYNEDGGFTGFSEPVYSEKHIKKGEALRLDIMIPEGMPTSYLSYKAGDREYGFVLGYNGRDGGISLMDISDLGVQLQ